MWIVKCLVNSQLSQYFFLFFVMCHLFFCVTIEITYILTHTNHSMFLHDTVKSLLDVPKKNASILQFSKNDFPKCIHCIYWEGFRKKNHSIVWHKTKAEFHNVTWNLLPLPYQMFRNIVHIDAHWHNFTSTPTVRNVCIAFHFTCSKENRIR